MKKILLGLVLLLAGIATLSGFYSVDRAEFVYVTRLGAHVATYDGADPEQAGLHFGWPWPVESVIRLDRRQRVF